MAVKTIYRIPWSEQEEQYRGLSFEFPGLNQPNCRPESVRTGQLYIKTEYPRSRN